jgi:hypothetical protein
MYEARSYVGRRAAATASYGRPKRVFAVFLAAPDTLPLRPTRRARLDERAQRHLAPPRPNARNSCRLLSVIVGYCIVRVGMSP